MTVYPSGAHAFCDELYFFIWVRSAHLKNINVLFLFVILIIFVCHGVVCNVIFGGSLFFVLTLLTIMMFCVGLWLSVVVPSI